jgi:hypothetical protein
MPGRSKALQQAAEARTMKIVALAMALVTAAAPAGAAILSGSLRPVSVNVSFGSQPAFTPQASGGELLRVDPVPMGFQLGWDDFNDSHVRGFDEVQGFVLSRRLRLNSGADIAAGTRISSHYISFDAPSRMSAVGSVQFDAPVLGLIWSNGRLAASDYLGLAQVVYQQPRARGIERVTDAVSFQGRRVDFRFVTNSPGDSIRVITAGAVPEPASWMMLIGGFGLVGWRLRRRAQMLAA